MLHEPPPERKPVYLVSLLKPRVEHLPLSESYLAKDHHTAKDQISFPSVFKLMLRFRPPWYVKVATPTALSALALRPGI